MRKKEFKGKNLTEVTTEANLPTERDRLVHLNKFKMHLKTEEILLKCSYGEFRFIKIGTEYTSVEKTK